MTKITKDMFLYNGILILCIVLSIALFSNKSTQGINWTFPYFSGAANFEKIFDWKISPSDVENVKKLGNTSELNNYIDYKHKRTDDLVLNTTNNYGYVLVAVASQNIFPFLGDLRGVIYFQIIIHIIISSFVINFIWLKVILIHNNGKKQKQPMSKELRWVVGQKNFTIQYTE